MSVLKNAKHERFAQALAAGKTQAEAYETSGYKPDSGAASRLSRNISVSARVQEILDRGAIRAEVTVASIIAELDEARALANHLEQASPMIAASMGKAKVAGLLIERTELTGKDGGAIQTEEVKARDEVSRRIAGLATRGGQASDHSKPN